MKARSSQIVEFKVRGDRYDEKGHVEEEFMKTVEDELDLSVSFG